jgi:hypothetical protein
VSRRLKALACTAPLHDLDARKGLVDWADASTYHMAEIALQAIDQVTIAMDFDAGASHDKIVAGLRDFIAAQAPDRLRAEHDRVARWVLENLINVGTTDRGFRAGYGTFAADGTYQRRAFDFKLIVEFAGPDGLIYLRTTDEAINVLIGALDTDLESAQIATEIKLDNLIRRGRLSDAKLAAEQARYRTVQYAEALRRKLDATRRDVKSVDWLHEMPELIDDALTHVADRLRAETAIAKNLTAARDTSVDPAQKKLAADLVVIMEDCVRRHSVLEKRIMEAGRVFRAEQDRQQFTGPALRATVDINGQLLVPALELPIQDAVGPLVSFFRNSVGLRITSAPDLVSLTQLLFVPPAERTDFVGDLVEPELSAIDNPNRFSADQWAASEELFAKTGVHRLSYLLALARETDPGLGHLLALRALYAFDPHLGMAINSRDATVLIAVDDGRILDDPDFGGADLLLTKALLDEEVEEEEEAA